MKRFSKILLLFVFFTSFVTWAQVAGDYRSAVTGDWDAVATWQTYDGSNWVAAVVKPGASNSVYVQYSHVVTLTGNEACNDLHSSVADGLGGVLAGIVKLQSYTLELNGKLRCSRRPEIFGAIEIFSRSAEDAVLYPGFRIGLPCGSEVFIVHPFNRNLFHTCRRHGKI